MVMADYEFTCVVIGAKNAGKTSFVKRHLNGSFNRWRVKRADVNSITFYTNHLDSIKMTFFEIREPDNMPSYMNIDCAIIMFDLQSKKSMEETNCLYEKFLKNYPNLPKVLCANKYTNDTRFKIKECEYPYFYINVKEKYNLMIPIVSLVSRLLKDPELKLVETDRTRKLKEGTNFEFITTETTDSYNKEVTCYDCSKCFNNMKIGVTL